MRGILTPKIARAAGMDAGNDSMRRAGRKKWSRADYNAAARECNRLLDILEQHTTKQPPASRGK